MSNTTDEELVELWVRNLGTGELIELCEKEGYIERYYVESPKDRVDLTISDMQRYTKTLIEEETNLTIMVEKALREIDKEDQENNNTDSEIIDALDVALQEIEATIHYDDYEEFEEFLEQEAEKDHQTQLGDDG